MASARKPIVENRKARHDYHILERVEAGIALTGTEVKSLRDGGGNLREAYAQLHDGEVVPGRARTSRRTARGTCRTTSPPASASSCCTGARSSSSGARWPSGG